MTNQIASSIQHGGSAHELLGVLLEEIAIASPRRNLERLLESNAGANDSVLEIPPMAYPIIQEDIQPRKSCTRRSASVEVKSKTGVWEWVRPSAEAILQGRDSFWNL